MKPVFNSGLLKIQTALQYSAYGKWKMDVFLNKIYFKLVIDEREPLSRSVWKLAGHVAFENGAFYVSEHCISLRTA